MKRGPLVFLAAFFALAASWFVWVLAPLLQIGGETQAVNLANAPEMYPQMRPGLARQGEAIYRANGCASCHTRQVGQTGVKVDVALNDAGTNLPAVASALSLAGALNAAPAGIAGGLPKNVLENLTPEAAKAAVVALRKAGAKAEVRLTPVGPDIARGWGQRQTVARDYLFDQPPMLGSQRTGPDLANVGQRLPDAAWHFRHLYSPQSVVTNSIMPRYKFLFDERPLKPGQPPSSDAIEIADGRSGSAREVVPTSEARALVAYLISLKTDAVLYETPMTVIRARAATNLPAK